MRLSVGIQFHQRAQRRFHRIGIGVVAVVDELDAVDFLDLQARLRQRRGGQTGRAFLERKAENAAGRDREHARFAPCAIPGTGNCARQRCAPSRIVNSHPLGRLAALRSRAWTPSSIPARITRARVRFAIASAKSIVRIQDHGTVRADRFGQRAFFLRDRFADAHEFDVRDPDVGDDARHPARRACASAAISPG